ncbi:hypothetical protein ACC759_37045, partial [Rhizobium ruizarguesonis]
PIAIDRESKAMGQGSGLRFCVQLMFPIGNFSSWMMVSRYNAEHTTTGRRKGVCRASACGWLR